MRRHTLLFGVVAGVTGLFLVATPDAVASCGDWLQHPSDSYATATNPPGAAGTNVLDDAGANPPSRQAPCNGPGCGRLPAQPAPVPTAPVNGPQGCEKIVVRASSSSFTIGSRQFAVHGSWDARPLRGFPSRIDHPPQA